MTLLIYFLNVLLLALRRQEEINQPCVKIPSSSARVTVLDRPSPPQKPLEISKITKEGCHLAWGHPLDDGGSPILHYIVEKMDLSRGTWSDAGMSTILSHEVARLTHRKEYRFRVKAVNTIGESDPLEAPKSIVAKNEFGWSTVSNGSRIFNCQFYSPSHTNFNATLSDEPDAPGKPQITDWDKDHVDLKWPAPDSDGGSPITGYIVQKKEKGSPYWVNAVHVPPNQTNVTVPDLTEGQEYEFRVIATNAAGQSEPSEPSDLITAKPRYRE